MAKFNPVMCEQDYVTVLGVALSALELGTAFKPTPPAAGGDQISIRLPKDRLSLLDAICSRASWSRNQVLIALIDRSIFALFEELPDKTANQIREDLLSRHCKTMSA